MKATHLVEHPEGGRYQEVFRSATVLSVPGRGGRAAITHIYFSLGAGERSRFHRIASDEVWNLYDGRGVRLYLWPEAAGSVEEVELSKESGSFCQVVPAGTWQAAVPIGGPVLVGCSVAPGFDFADFELLDQGSPAGGRLTGLRPDLSHLLQGERAEVGLQ